MPNKRLHRNLLTCQEMVKLRRLTAFVTGKTS
jgi:hypothetical protein